MISSWKTFLEAALAYCGSKYSERQPMRVKIVDDDGSIYGRLGTLACQLRKSLTGQDVLGTEHILRLIVYEERKGSKWGG